MQNSHNKRVLIRYCFIFVFFIAITLMIKQPNQDIAISHCLPQANHLLGCSPLGQDVISLTYWGALKTGAIALGGRLLATLLALGGFILAYTSSFFNNIMLRFTEVFMTIPSLLLALAFGFAFGGNFISIILAIGISEWATNQKWLLTRLQEYKRFSFTQSSQLMNASKWHILSYHLFPLLRRDLMVLFFLYFPSSILGVAALEFLGLSSGDSIPGLGFQVAAYKDYIFIYPNIILPSVIAIVALVAISLYFKQLSRRRNF